jgi:hypothetical protein
MRQALGLGALRYIKQNVQQHSQPGIIDEFSNLLELLLPKISPDNIRRIATKAVNKAVTLKHALTVEQAVYHCYWIPGGSRFDPESIDIEAGERGFIYLCTFPGLARMIKDEGSNSQSTLYVVKASAILQSAVQDIHSST